MNDKLSSQPFRLTPEELQRQRARSKALALTLGALVILFFIVTIAKLGGNVFNRPI